MARSINSGRGVIFSFLFFGDLFLSLKIRCTLWLIFVCTYSEFTAVVSTKYVFTQQYRLIILARINIFFEWFSCSHEINITKGVRACHNLKEKFWEFNRKWETTFCNQCLQSIKFTSVEPGNCRKSTWERWGTWTGTSRKDVNTCSFTSYDVDASLT